MTQTPRLAPGITFLNAELRKGEFTSLRIVGPRIASLGEDPGRGDSIIDLQGDRVLPGLINAHDHLQLNSLPNPRTDKRYQHVREWIADVNLRRQHDPEFESSIAVARDERLLLGGMKNLLSGVTTVAHHDPYYPWLSSAEFPTGVVRDYGWSHSLYVDGDDKVAGSCRATPGDWPWIIHAAEGLDDASNHEFDRLDALGCLGPNTLLVHGVALDQVQRMRLDRAGAGLIWCPSSNLRLFGRTADVSELADRGRVALGTDSRMSGGRDLLDELCLVDRLGVLSEDCCESLVTKDSARLLRLHDRGEIRVGARADILVLPAQSRLGAVTRSNVRLVLIAGVARYGDMDYATCVSRHLEWSDITVDGRTKVLDRVVADFMARAGVAEPGLDLAKTAGKAA